jgi:hypothetical protein
MRLTRSHRCVDGGDLARTEVRKPMQPFCKTGPSISTAIWMNRAQTSWGKASASAMPYSIVNSMLRPRAQLHKCARIPGSSAVPARNFICQLSAGTAEANVPSNHNERPLWWTQRPPADYEPRLLAEGMCEINSGPKRAHNISGGNSVWDMQRLLSISPKLRKQC